MHARILALTGIALLMLVAGVLLVLGRTDYEVSLDAALEVWGDIARDADFIGLTVTRVSAEREMEIGREIEADILRWFEESSDAELQAYVDDVGQSLAAQELHHQIDRAVG